MILTISYLKKIFGYTFVALVEKLINTVDKKENQTTVHDIKNNKDKIYREYKFEEDVVKRSGDLSDAVKIILETNQALKSNKVKNNFMELLNI